MITGRLRDAHHPVRWQHLEEFRKVATRERLAVDGFDGVAHARTAHLIKGQARSVESRLVVTMRAWRVVVWSALRFAWCTVSNKQRAVPASNQ